MKNIAREQINIQNGHLNKNGYIINIDDTSKGSVEIKFDSWISSFPRSTIKIIFDQSTINPENPNTNIVENNTFNENTNATNTVDYNTVDTIDENNNTITNTTNNIITENTLNNMNTQNTLNSNTNTNT